VTYAALTVLLTILGLGTLTWMLGMFVLQFTHRL
jgi:hypothetical protein